MRLSSHSILDIPITTSSEDDILKNVKDFLNSPVSGSNPLVIFTPNPEIIESAQSDPSLKKILQEADIALPDGWGVVWALRLRLRVKITRITGADMMEKLLKKVKDQTITVGLLGGKSGVALSSAKCLQNSYPSLTFEVFEVGEVSIESIQNTVSSIQYDYQKLIEWIKKKKINILFVALGFPKQEYFVHDLAYRIPNTGYDKPLVLMAVGGSLDYISGNIKRAPKILQDLKWEWLYRLIIEPSRLGRQLRGVKFFLRILMNKIH